MTTHLVWLRADLRIKDNPALYAACQQPDAKVIACWWITPQQWQQHGIAEKQLKFMHDSLVLLQQGLSELNIQLQILQGCDFQSQPSQLLSYCQQQGVSQIFYNYQYEYNEMQRDRRVEKTLQQAGIICQGFHDSVLLAPGTVLTAEKRMYQVFTPFRTAVIRRLLQSLPECYPSPEVRKGVSAGKPTAIAHFYSSGEEAQYDEKLFPPGEQQAIQALRQFSAGRLADYPEQRDIPASAATSMLSAWLATGQLSPRQCLHRVLRDHPQALQAGAGFSWLNEIIWREFYRHLLVAWPALCRYQPFQSWTDNIVWNNDDQLFSAWCEGKTGYPIVDAGMRQLNNTGWMHNRLRMICASFLVKDLLIDWRKGERYFIEHLIDGDLAANNGGWQWAASTGTDAAPYFRIFNPQLQGEKFDPEGEFIKQWLPELSRIPSKMIHQPWSWADKQGMTLEYPRPVVDHSQARKSTLAAFEQARSQEKK